MEDSFTNNLEALLAEVKKIAIKSGDFIKEESVKFSIADVEEKSKNSLVTYVDKKAEKLIVDFLETLIPNCGFIAEEGTSDKIGQEFNWIIDPLDGTTNFIHGIPNYSVSIALRRGDEIVLGVVYEPNRKECFSAFKGGGSFLNSKRIEVTSTTCIEDALFATGFPYYDYQFMEGYLKVLTELMKESRGIRRIGSAAIDLSYVACGRFDAFYEYSLNAWDVAAGALIVKEAGGVVTDFKGNENYLFGKQIIAGSMDMQNVILEKIKSNF